MQQSNDEVMPGRPATTTPQYEQMIGRGRRAPLASVELVGQTLICDGSHPDSGMDRVALSEAMIASYARTFTPKPVVDLRGKKVTLIEVRGDDFIHRDPMSPRGDIPQSVSYPFKSADFPANVDVTRFSQEAEYPTRIAAPEPTPGVLIEDEELDAGPVRLGSVTYGRLAEGQEVPEPRLTFAEAIDAQVTALRAMDSSFGDWLASKVDELARDARFLGAKSPAEFEDRMKLLDDMRSSAERNGI